MTENTENNVEEITDIEVEDDSISLEVNEETFSISGQEFIVGLRWVVIEEPSDVINYLEEFSSLKFKRGITLYRTRSEPVCLGLCKSEGYSLAALLSLSLKDNQNILIIEKLEEDKYWICAISEKEVIAGSDIIGDVKSISSNLSSLSNVGGFETYGSGISDFLNDADVGDTEELINMSLLKKSHLKPLSKLKNSDMVKVVLIVAFILAMVFTGYKIVQKKEKTDYKPDPFADLKVLQQKMKERLASITIQPSPSEIFELINKHIKETPIRIGGWELKSIHCTENKCKLVFKNQKFGKTTELIDYFQDDHVDFNNRGDIATILFDANVEKTAENNVNNLSELGRQRLKLIDMSQEFLRIKIALDVSDSSIPRINGIQKHQSSVQVYEIGSFKCSGRGIDELKYVVSRLNLPGLFVDKIEIEANESSWNISGFYVGK